MNFATRLKDELSIIRLWFETFDGKQLQLTHGNSTLVLFDGLGSPEMRPVTVRGVGQHGDVLIDTLFEPRVMNFQLKRLNCGCVGLCAADIDNGVKPTNCSGLRQFSAFAYITNLLRYRGGVSLLKCQFKDGTVRQLNSWPIQLPQYQISSRVRGVAGGLQTAFRLYAPSPFWESETEHSLSDTVPINAYATVTARNCGSVEAKPHMSFTVDRGDNLTIENQSTGKTIALANLSGAPFSVTIDLRPDVRNRPTTKILQGGVDIAHRVTDPSALAKFAISQSPFASNGNSQIRAITTATLPQAGEELSMTVNWRDRFLGAIV